MFNIDRYATKNLGYDTKQYPNMLCIEGESNSDVGSSAFFAYSDPNSSGNQFPNEIAYHNEGWRVVYPSINEASYDFSAIKRLVDFVGTSSDDDFKDSFEQYFNKESVLKYYLFDMFIGGIDGLSKNFHLCSWDGLVYYVLPYDLDSCLGGTNTGYLRVPPSAEVGTLYDNDGVTVLEENHFNSWNSQLWRRVRNTFSVDLENMYKTLRSNGLFTLENMLTYFDAVTDIISPKMYNDSQQIKYINDGAVGMVALHGNRKLQIRKWLRERIAYLDSKYGYYAGGGVGENYCNFRMNYQGAVSLDLTTYYTVYAKVRWATNNEQTIRISRGQKKTFSYYSDVGTDREVMIFLPEALKTIENISKIYPNSIDVSKATKLTQIEAHNSNLFSVDLSKNKYLRKIDFNGCERLGTETATMTLNFCKYLNKVDLRGTQITAVNFNTKGGSLREIYFPKTIQSVNLLNQLLLTDMVLPYGEDGSNAPVQLATINIENCPNIQRLIDTTSDPASLSAMKYCRNLTLNNAIKLDKFNFYGFTRLANVNLQNMETLKEVDFLNMTKKGEETSLRYIGVSACPILTKISMNCDDPNYEITWADNSLLDLQTAGGIEEITSNCIIKGLETIVIPRSIKGLYFTNEYGSGYSDIKNIWSAEASTIVKTGVFPVPYHLNEENVVDEYEGIDFRGLHLLNIDLGALVQIPDAINFSLYPTQVNPNFNLHRDGTTLPYLQPKGILDLSDYTESLAKFFNGVDLDLLEIICNKELSQTDYSYCFYNSTFSSRDKLMPLINQIGNAKNLSYMFYKTTIDSTEILDTINYANNGLIYDYCFGECPNITNADDLILSPKTSSAVGMFYKCPNLTSASYMQIKVNGSVSKMFSDCKKLSDVSGLDMANVTDTSYMLNNCPRIDEMIEELPSSCNNADYMYSNTNISECEFIDVPFGSSTCTYEGFIGGASGITVRLKFTSGNPSAIGGILTDTNNMIVDITELNMRNHPNLSNWFKDKTALKEIIVENVLWGTGNINLSNAFNGCINLKNDIQFPLNTVNVNSCYLNCISLEDIHSNWNQEYKGSIVPNNCYLGCPNTQTLDGVFVRNLHTTPLDECPVLWGGYGFFKEYTGIYEFKIPSDNYTIYIMNTMEDGAINWGDGLVEKYGVVAYDTSVSTNSDKWITHTYETAGTYTIKAKSILSCRKYYGKGIAPHSTIQETLTKVIQVPRTIVQSAITTNDKYCMMSAFYGCYMLTYADLTNLNENIVYFNNLFYDCQQLKELKFGNIFVTTSTVNLSSTFYNCYSLKIDMENLPIFPYCQSATLINTFYRFGYSTLIEENEEVHLDLRIMFPHQKETFSIGSMGSNFNGCGATKITLPDRVKITGLTDGRSTFSNAPYLKYIDMNGMQYHLQDMRGTFSNCPSLETIDFTGCTFILGDYLGSAFANCPKLKNFIVGEGEYIDFTDTISDYITYQNVFENCNSVEDLSMFKFKAKAKHYTRMFYNCNKLTTLPTFVDDNGNPTKELIGVSGALNGTFAYCKGLVDLSDYTLGDNNYGISGLCFVECENLVHLGKVYTTNLGYAEYNQTFSYCKNLTTIDELVMFPGSITTDANGEPIESPVRVFAHFFRGCVKLANVNFTGTGQTCYAPNMGFNEAPLTRESIVSFFNVLSSHIGYKPMGSSNQITIHRYSYLLLSAQDIAIATDKGWIVTQSAT